MRIRFFFPWLSLCDLGNEKWANTIWILKNDKFCKENIVNRFTKPKRHFFCASRCALVWQSMPNEKVRMAGSLAKRLPGKPALSVGVSPCNTFTSAWQIYETERKEVPLRAKCEFLVPNDMIFVQPLRNLRRSPNQEITEKKKSDSHYNVEVL